MLLAQYVVQARASDNDFRSAGNDRLSESENNPSRLNGDSRVFADNVGGEELVCIKYKLPDAEVRTRDTRHALGGCIIAVLSRITSAWITRTCSALSGPHAYLMLAALEFPLPRWE